MIEAGFVYSLVSSAHPGVAMLKNNRKNILTTESLENLFNINKHDNFLMFLLFSFIPDFAINHRFTPLDVYYLMGVHREIPF